MTGKVKAYFYPHIRDRLYRHTIIMQPGQIAIASHSMAGDPTSYAMMLTTDPGVLRATESEFQAYLALCRPMLNTYSEPQKLFPCFMKFLSPQGFRIQKLISLSAVTAPFELVADSIGKREDPEPKRLGELYLQEMMRLGAGSVQSDRYRSPGQRWPGPCRHSAYHGHLLVGRRPLLHPGDLYPALEEDSAHFGHS